MTLGVAMALNHNHYIVLNNVVSKEMCDFLCDYIQFKSALKPNKKKDFLAGVHREYGDLVMETLLAQLTPVVEKATDLSLWPTLSFYYLYKNGDQLAPHKDRNSCQIVAGLCIGADSEFKEKHQHWPLIMEIEGKPKSIPLNYGDMVIFKGFETMHWRDPFEGSWFISAIFGFVDKEGPFSFQKYDQRPMLGKPHVGMFRWMYGSIKNALKQRIQAITHKD